MVATGKLEGLQWDSVPPAFALQELQAFLSDEEGDDAGLTYRALVRQPENWVDTNPAKLDTQQLSQQQVADALTEAARELICLKYKQKVCSCAWLSRRSLSVSLLCGRCASRTRAGACAATVGASERGEKPTGHCTSRS